MTTLAEFLSTTIKKPRDVLSVTLTSGAVLTQHKDYYRTTLHPEELLGPKTFFLCCLNCLIQALIYQMRRPVESDGLNYASHLSSPQ